MKLAFLYAGQGSQHPGMGADLYQAYPEFRAVLDGARLDFDIKTVSFTDPDGVLNQTEYTQPCMVAFAAGMTAILAGKGIRPDYAAGLSLGEYSALAAAGVFTATQAVELAAFRGRAMAQAAAGVPCGMTAVLGLDRDKLQAACQAASSEGVVEIANYNCPGQLVIGGHKAAVDAAAARAKELGAKRCLPLKVSGPFHTSLLAPAGDALRQRFASEHFGPMQFPVLFNCLGREMGEGDTIPRPAGAAGAVLGLHGGHHPPHGGSGRGHHRGDRPRQGAERLCQKDRSRHQDHPCGDLRRHRRLVRGAERRMIWAA